MIRLNFLLVAFFVCISFTNAQVRVLIKDKSVNGFANAISMTSDARGYIYALDNETCEIIKYSDDLNEIKRTGRKGWSTGEFFSPTNIDCSTGLSLYVSDKKNGRIQIFDLDLGFTNSIVTDLETSDPKYRCRFPVASVVLNTKDLYVVDEDNPKVVVFESSVNPVLYFASYQSGGSSLQLPVKIVKDSRNILYVFDNGRNAILKYDNFGTYVSSLTPDSIRAMSITKDILYIISGNYLIYYNVDRNAYTNKIYLPDEIDKNEITDILVTNSNKLFISEKTKITSFIIK